jgi:hypothetical protein
VKLTLKCNSIIITSTAGKLFVIVLRIGCINNKNMNFLHTTMLTNDEDKNVSKLVLVMGSPHRSESML